MQLGYRFSHILRRMMPIAMFLLQREGHFPTGHDLFLKRVGASFHAFIEGAEKACRQRCMEDLLSTTRYVTWSLHTKSRASLKAMLGKVRILNKALSSWLAFHVKRFCAGSQMGWQQGRGTCQCVALMGPD